MTYNCDITLQDNWYIPKFPDMTNVLTCAETKEGALEMAKDALNGVLEVDLEHELPIPEPSYRGGHPVEVEPRIALAINLRKARASRSQKEIAALVGISRRQYRKLETSQKSNPTLDTLCRLQKALGQKFLAL